MMKRLFKFRYPKLFLLVIFIILAYVIFSNPIICLPISENFNNLWGFFLAGIVFAFGFTAPFSIGFFLTATPPNILLYGFIAGLGALCTDLLIFHFIRFTFLDEFKRLEKSKPIKFIDKEIEKETGPRLFHYLGYIFAGFIIATPLPDEIGVMLLSGLTKIKTIPFAILCICLHTIGILAMMYLGVII
jgi:hypothetical protein